MAKVSIPTFRMNNGREIPALGYGTWLGLDSNSPKDDSDTFSYEVSLEELPKMMEALSYAIDVGYRHVDTAHLYRVEPEVGQVVNDKIAQGVVTRDDMFITTKVWQHFHRAGDVEVSLRGSLRRLNMDYVDLLLMHWPMAISQDGVDEKIDYVETWRGFEAVLGKGLTRGIGVSNFNEEQIRRLLQHCTVKPAVNQVEINLNLGQESLVSLCSSQGILLVAYSPFGTMVPTRAAPHTPPPKLDDPTMQAIANKYNKSVPQVALRYLYQRGIVSIPKTVTKSRVLENASIFDFNLSADEMTSLRDFECDFRTVRPVFWQEYTNYPFDKSPTKMEIPPALLRWKNGIHQNID